MKNLFPILAVGLFPCLGKAEMRLVEAFNKDQLINGVQIASRAEYSEANAQYKFVVTWNHKQKANLPIDIQCGGQPIIRVWSRVQNHHFYLSLGSDIIQRCPADSPLVMQIQALDFAELSVSKWMEEAATIAVTVPALGTQCLSSEGRYSAVGSLFVDGPIPYYCTSQGIQSPLDGI